MKCRVINAEIAKEVMYDPEIVERVGKGELPTKNVVYVGGYDSNKLFGVFMYLLVANVMTCHMHILKEFRGKYGVRFGKKALAFSPKKELITNIPETFKDVVRYAKYFGFKLVDTVKHDGENILIYKRN